MADPTHFDPSNHVIGLDGDFAATKLPEQPDPPVPFSGVTFGVATMSQNSPHNGEMHPDGDEILYLISGRVRVVFVDGDAEDSPWQRYKKLWHCCLAFGQPPARP